MARSNEGRGGVRCVCVVGWVGGWVGVGGKHTRGPYHRGLHHVHRFETLFRQKHEVKDLGKLVVKPCKCSPWTDVRRRAVGRCFHEPRESFLGCPCELSKCISPTLGVEIARKKHCLHPVMVHNYIKSSNIPNSLQYCMEEHTCGARLPHINGTVVRKRENIGVGGGGWGDTCGGTMGAVHRTAWTGPRQHHSRVWPPIV